MKSIQQKGGSVRWYVLGVLVAIELLMSFSFLGYIHVEPISVTFAYIPVLLAGALLGPLEATLVGTVFGLASMWKASADYVMDFDQLFSPFSQRTASGKLSPQRGGAYAVWPRCGDAVSGRPKSPAFPDFGWGSSPIWDRPYTPCWSIPPCLYCFRRQGTGPKMP